MPYDCKSNNKFLFVNDAIGRLHNKKNNLFEFEISVKKGIFSTFNKWYFN